MEGHFKIMPHFRVKKRTRENYPRAPFPFDLEGENEGTESSKKSKILKQIMEMLQPWPEEEIEEFEAFAKEYASKKNNGRQFIS